MYTNSFRKKWVCPIQTVYTFVPRPTINTSIQSRSHVFNVCVFRCDGDLFFIWPMTVVHRIDQNSPLFYLSASDMLQDRFEIVVILEGTIESTGQTTQARSSYIATEVLWGHRSVHFVFLYSSQTWFFNKQPHFSIKTYQLDFYKYFPKSLKSKKNCVGNFPFQKHNVQHKLMFKYKIQFTVNATTKIRFF